MKASNAVWYGDEQIPVDLPPDVATRIAAQSPLTPAKDPLATVATALDHPRGAPPLEEAAKGAERVAIVVPDAARPSGADTYVLPVIARLARAGLVPRQISIILARGLHVTTTRSNVERVLGPGIREAIRTVQSQPETPEVNVSIGEDPQIGDVRIHRLVAESDLVVLTGAVAPHPLAGFSGGSKALAYGVGERGTIAAAHRLALGTAVRPDGSVRSLAGRLDGNPFSDALLRVARAFGRCWQIAVGLDAAGDVAVAFAGEVGEAHHAAAAAWSSARKDDETFTADLVIVGTEAPLHRDLVLAHRSLIAASLYAAPGAPIVWFARAPAGAGHPALLPWFEIRKLKDHLAALRREYHPHGLTAYWIRRIAAEHPVHIVSEMGADLLRPLGLLPFRDGKRAIAHALDHAKNPVRTCAVLP